MKNRLWAVSLLAIISVLSGCVSQPRMAFSEDSERWNEQSKPVLLMTVTLKNAYRPPYQPRLFIAHVEKLEDRKVADRLGFKMDDKGRAETHTRTLGNSYFIRFELDPGTYRIRGLTSLFPVFPIRGRFFTPLYLPFEVKDRGVYYLGHVNATVRERQGDEFRAGPVFPLVDQGVVGATGGTFDVEILDRFEIDEPLFRKRFPALSGVTIQKAILPPFDRAKAQAKMDNPRSE